MCCLKSQITKNNLYRTGVTEQNQSFDHEFEQGKSSPPPKKIFQYGEKKIEDNSQRITEEEIPLPGQT